MALLRSCGEHGERWNPAQRQPTCRVLAALLQPRVQLPDCDCAQLARPHRARARPIAEVKGCAPEWNRARVCLAHTLSSRRVPDECVLCSHWHSARARAAREALAHMAMDCSGSTCCSLALRPWLLRRLCGAVLACVDFCVQTTSQAVKQCVACL